MSKSTTCTSTDFTKWLEMEKIPASGKLALFEAAQTYLVVDHNTAHRAHIFATTTPTRFVCACCYRRAVRRFSASPGMPPLSPTKKKGKRDGKIRFLRPCNCSCCVSQTRKARARGAMCERRCHRGLCGVRWWWTSTAQDGATGDLWQQNRRECGDPKRMGGCEDRVVYDSDGCAMRTRFESELPSY